MGGTIMRVHLFVKWEDVEKYERGEVIEAANGHDKGQIFEYYRGDILPVSVYSKEVIGREDVVKRGIVKGTFSKFLIQKM
jgi:hypothetical protein